jgi:NAD(P)-dependent dehydrogenase (short-subunit alcohol dehydrogenase family)
MKACGFLWRARSQERRRDLPAGAHLAHHGEACRPRDDAGEARPDRGSPENDAISGGANPMAHAVKTAQKVLPLQWATELAAHGITVLAITPGFLRSKPCCSTSG